MKQFIQRLHLEQLSLKLRHFLLGKSFTSAHGGIQIFTILSWLLFLTKTDAYYVIYLIIGIGGLFCRRAVTTSTSDRQTIFFRSERPNVRIAALFSIAVMCANYPLFENHLTIAASSPLVISLFGALECTVRLIVIFLGGLYTLYFILRWITLKAVPFVWTTRNYDSKPASLFLVTFGLFAAVYSSILFLCFYPGILTHDSMEQIEQIMSGHYSNHHPFYHTEVIGLCMETGKLFFKNINQQVALYSFFSTLLMSFTFAYTTTTLYRLNISMKIVTVVMLAYLLLPYHILYSFTMWKDIPFSAFVLIFTVSVFRLIENVGSSRHLTVGLILLSTFGICLFRSNGLFAFVITFLVFACFYGKQHPKICILLASILILSWVLKHPVLKILDVTQPDTIESLSIPAQQMARVVAQCDDLTENQKDLIAKVADIEKIPRDYKAYISDPIKENVRAKGNQEYLTAHKWEYIRLYVTLGLSHPKQYFEAWVEQTKGYWNAGYDYTLWWIQVSENNLGIKKRISSDTLYGICRTYSSNFQKIEWLKPFVSIGLHTWCLLLTAYIGWRKKDKLTVFLTVPVIAILFSLLIATPVYSEFRYAYSLFCCLPFLAVIAFRRSTATEEMMEKVNENLVGSGEWGVERKKKKKRSATSERMRARESRGTGPPRGCRAAPCWGVGQSPTSEAKPNERNEPRLRRQSGEFV